MAAEPRMVRMPATAPADRLLMISWVDIPVTAAAARFLIMRTGLF
jgi:hypothetical protein